MGFIDRILGREKLVAKIQEIEQRAERTEKIMALSKLDAKIQESILEGDKATWEPIDYQYRNREGIIKELDRKFKGIAEWGNELVPRIAKTRAAFALSGGVDTHPITEEEKDSDEAEFIKDFIQKNGLDGAKLQDFGIEKVLEGQLLFGLDWIEMEGDPRYPYGGYVRITHFPYLEFGYSVEFVDDLPDRGIEKIEWKDDDGQTKTLDAQTSVFMRFNCRVNEENGWPDIGGGILTALDRISKNLEHWRTLNWLFSHPTPLFNTETREEADDLYSWLSSEEINWRVGKMIATDADFSLVSGRAGDWVSIKEEITRDVQMISAHTGVPPQFLGFPELMSNRATAENTMEPVSVVSMSEQKTWKDGYDQMFNKAIQIYNQNLPTGGKMLREEIIEAEFAFVTTEQMRIITSLYYPLWKDKGLSLDTLLSMLPGIDAEQEIAKIEQEMEAETARTQAMAGDLLNEMDQTPEPDLEVVNE